MGGAVASKVGELGESAEVFSDHFVTSFHWDYFFLFE